MTTFVKVPHKSLGGQGIKGVNLSTIDVHVWVLETFGLNGERYLYHPTSDAMVYEFDDEKDAIHFALRWNGLFISKHAYADW